jgi:predicted RNA-binding Zn ribbon-like protein
MRPRRTIPDSDWRDGFLFVGNHLALDFLNTRPVQNGEPTELLSDFSALLRWFHAAGLVSCDEMTNLQRQSGESATGRALDDMRQFREKLRKEVLAWEGGADLHCASVEELNRLMAAHPMLSKLTVTGTVPSMERWFELHQPEDSFAPFAPQGGEVVRRSGSEPCSQVWTMRAAFL